MPDSTASEDLPSTDRIGGVNVIRLLCTPFAHDDGEKESLTWRLSLGGASASRGTIVFFGDLNVSNGGERVSVTVFSQVRTKSAASVNVDDPLAEDKILEAWAPRVTHIMYDVAATAARSLVAQCFGIGLDVSWSTPTTILARKARDPEAPEVPEAPED